MASPDAEWLLWREQYKIHSKSVSHQLITLTQATSQIEDVTAKIADLATSRDRLQAHNDALNERIISLEKNADQQNKLNEHLQADNDRLTYRMVHLEQDANQQDQINAMNSQAKSELEVKLEKLKGDFVNVIEAVGTMQATTKAESEGQRKQIAEMKVQMEGFMNIPAQRHLASAGWGPRDTVGLLHAEPKENRSAREMSQATTADESMQIGQDQETSLLDRRHCHELPGTTQLYTQYPEDTQTNTNSPSINMVEQGNSPIEEYLNYGDEVVIEGVKLYEVQAVKTFISGLRDKYAQQLLTDRLEKIGWTWEKAKEEIHRMIEEGKKRKRNRRTMPAFA